MIRAMRRGLLLVLVALPTLTACGSTTTKTVTTVVPAPVTTSTTPTTTSTFTTSSTPTVTTATTSTSGPAAVYFQGVTGSPQQRPRTLELTGDGTLFVSGVQWSSWGGPVASGTGNAEYHGCTPNCASAPVHNALVAVRMFGVRACSGGRQFYSGVTLTLNSGALLDKTFMQRSWAPC
jgi:hypothetical protein